MRNGRGVAFRWRGRLLSPWVVVCQTFNERTPPHLIKGEALVRRNLKRPPSPRGGSAALSQWGPICTLWPAPPAVPRCGSSLLRSGAGWGEVMILHRDLARLCWGSEMVGLGSSTRVIPDRHPLGSVTGVKSIMDPVAPRKRSLSHTHGSLPRW